MGFEWLILVLLLLSAVNADMGGLIINGKKVSKSNNDYRFIVSLQRRMGKQNYRHYCGGALIDHSLVLTAAHCVKYNTAHSRVRIGSYNVDSGGVTRQVDKVTIHPKYSSLNYDFALLHLKDPVYTIRPIRLPMQGVSVKPQTPVVSIGWGYTREGSGQTTKDLMEVDLVTLTNKVCNKKYWKITSSMLCTWGEWDNAKGQRKDACSGDSGSPNFFYDGDTIIHAGVTSWGRGCGRKDYPGVTARVSEVVDWISPHFEMSTMPIYSDGHDF